MTPYIQFPLPTLPPPVHQAKTSKGIRAYPDGWRQVLNYSKDIIRASILLQVPFPRPAQARITVNESFHEAATIERENGTVLESGTFLSKILFPSGRFISHQLGFSWSDKMMTTVSHH